MTIWNIIALIIGGICGLACLALAVFGALVFVAVMLKAKEDYKNWDPDK